MAPRPRGPLTLASALGALVVLFACLVPSGALAAADRLPVDRRDLEGLGKAQPEALRAFEAGEARMAAGDVAGAAELFFAAAERAPDSAIVPRRYCQALTALGRRNDAIPACKKAVANGGSPMDLRAMVGALMAGPEAPTSEELLEAASFARRATDLLPRQAWGYAADCDIAWRLGDDALLSTCMRKLERLAPGHYETERLLARVSAKSRSVASLAGLVALGALYVGTLGHALLRSRRRRMARGVAAAVTFGALAALSPRAMADGTTPEPSPRWTVDEANPEASVPPLAEANRDPLQFGYFVLDLTGRADDALAHGDYQAAVKYFRATVKAAPDAAIGYANLCRSYEGLGDAKHAIESCREALVRQGVTLDDYARFVHLVLATPGVIPPPQVAEVDDVVRHLKSADASRVAALHLECEIGARLEDVRRLEECTAGLRAAAPDDAKTIAFEWMLALKRGNYAAAEALVDRARSAGMAPSGVEEMQVATRAARPIWQRALRSWRVDAAILVVLAVTLMLVLSRRRAART